MRDTNGRQGENLSCGGLPNDLETCHVLLLEKEDALLEKEQSLREKNEAVLERDQKILEKEKLHAELRATLKELQEENQAAKWRIEILLHKLYGRRSERHTGDEANDPMLPGFEEEADGSDASDANDASIEEEYEPEPLGHEEPASADEKATPRKKKNRPGLHGRGELPSHLERRETLIDVEDDEKSCDDCGTPRKIIGYVRSERLNYDPPKLFVEVEVRPKFALDCECENDKAKPIVVAEKPIRPIDRGLPGLGLLVYVVIGKYVYHLPHYRQAERVLKQAGVTLSRQVLWDWTRGVSDLLKPLWELMQRQLSLSRVIGADETPVQMQVRENGNVHMKQAYFWVYYGDDRAPFTVFDFQPTREGSAPEAFLRKFKKGYLQTDGYTGYNRVTGREGITSVGCWAHARRKFKESIFSSPIESAEALVRIRELYDIERKAAELSATERQAVRAQQSQPVLDKLRAWLDSMQGSSLALPKSPLGGAIGYALNQWEELTRFMEDGELRLDNNLVEASLRDVGIGRKNWMFVGSERGGRAAAIIYSIVITARRHGLDVWQYLTDILPRLADLAPGELEHLLPNRWQPSPTPTEKSSAA